MSSEFAPIIMVAVVWLVIGLPVILAKRAAGQKTPARRNPAQAPAETRPAAQELPPERLTTLTPSVSFSGHDDSVYQGSMNAVTGEGYDPCHDEQMAELTLAEIEEPAPAAAPQTPRKPQAPPSSPSRPMHGSMETVLTVPSSL